MFLFHYTRYLDNIKGMKKTYLIILDGVGFAPDGPGNAVALAKKPFLENLWKDQPLSMLKTHGEVVGLPEFQMGGSEVGHLAIGAGRTIKHILTTINEDVESGEICKKEKLCKLLSRSKEKGKIHLVGMTSDGGIHSFLPHLLGLQKMAKEEGIQDIFIHAFLDGRDVGQRSCEGFLQQVDDMNAGTIATLGGRFYDMDRDKNWERTERAYRSLCDTSFSEDGRSWKEVIDDFYEHNPESDYYVPPALLHKGGQIQPGDIVICFNYRTDRMRQIMAAFCDDDFENFERPFVLDAKDFGVFGNYYPDAHTIYEMKSESKQNTLGEVISRSGGTQLRVTETEKFNHVTFFFSGERKEPFEGEDRILVPSFKCPSYAEKPDMSAVEQTDVVMERLEEKDYDFVIQNYANGDMVGHSGDLQAGIKAVETVDSCLTKLVPFLLNKGYQVAITADHGNCDEMIYPDGSVSNAHSKNLVPFLILDPSGEKVILKPYGTLVDVAPTMLDLLGLEKPEDMTGKNLIE